MRGKPRGSEAPARVIEPSDVGQDGKLGLWRRGLEAAGLILPGRSADFADLRRLAGGAFPDVCAPLPYFVEPNSKTLRLIRA